MIANSIRQSRGMSSNSVDDQGAFFAYGGIILVLGVVV